MDWDLEAFWERVDRSEGCWLWNGVIKETGYGRFRHSGKWLVAHRVSYELHKGTIPENMQIDHLCRVRHCVNPEHLEAVSPRENILRGVGPTAINAAKEYCDKGHPFSDENTYLGPQGWRYCRTCVESRRRASASLRKKTHCRKGHEFTAENTVRWGKMRRCVTCLESYKPATKCKHGHEKTLKGGQLVCNPCHRKYSRNYYQKLKEENRADAS